MPTVKSQSRTQINRRDKRSFRRLCCCMLLSGSQASSISQTRKAGTKFLCVMIMNAQKKKLRKQKIHVIFLTSAGKRRGLVGQSQRGFLIFSGGRRLSTGELPFCWGTLVFIPWPETCRFITNAGSDNQTSRN